MNNIITISREFGSGGKELGKRIAEELGYAYYDKEIIDILAKETNLSSEYIDNISEKGIYPISFQFARSFSLYSSVTKAQIDLCVETQKVLKQIAEKGNAVIVGRGANVILKNYNPINIFVYASMESKIKRCRIKEDKKKLDFKNDEKVLTDKELEKMIINIDKKRSDYHSSISNLKWSDMQNYDLCINTSNLEIKSIVKSLKEFLSCYVDGRK